MCKSTKWFILIQLYPPSSSFTCTSTQVYLFQTNKSEKAENSFNFLICRNFSVGINITELKRYDKKSNDYMDKLFRGIFMGQV